MFWINSQFQNVCKTAAFKVIGLRPEHSMNKAPNLQNSRKFDIVENSRPLDVTPPKLFKEETISEKSKIMHKNTNVKSIKTPPFYSKKNNTMRSTILSEIKYSPELTVENHFGLLLKTLVKTLVNPSFHLLFLTTKVYQHSRENQNSSSNNSLQTPLLMSQSITLYLLQLP